MKTVLTKREKEQLKQIKTTKQEARKIRRRNVGLLDWLDNYVRQIEEADYAVNWVNRMFHSKHGCPHCKWDEGCRNCAWYTPHLSKKAPSTQSCPDGEGRFCLLQTFGGVSYSNLTQRYSRYILVCYGADMEEIWLRLGEFDPTDKKDRSRFQHELLRVRKFLLGHIEWADLILKGK